MTTAVYALSADPITKGHINIIERATKMFDQVIIAIGNNNNKTYLFDVNERVSIVEKSISHLKKEYKIKVKSFNGALADFSKENGINVIIRGLRNINDFQFEQDLGNINKELNPDLETCFLLADQNNSSISSSASKEIIKNNYTAHNYLPLISKVSLQKAINNQTFVGITGLMGSGKSFIAEELDKYSESQNIKILNLDLDLLCHDVYNQKIKTFEKERQKIIEKLGTIERKEIAQIVFKSNKKLEELNEIFRPIIEYQIRKYSTGFEGIILINGATLVSMNFISSLCNNQIIMVKTNYEKRVQRCQSNRFIKRETIDERDLLMLDYQEQEDKIKESINKNNYGFYFEIQNNDNKPNIEKLYNKIIHKTHLN